LVLTKCSNEGAGSIKSVKLTDKPSDYRFYIPNKIRTQVFDGLKPEIWGLNSDRYNGFFLLRCPTLSYKYKRPETSPACRNVGSESYRQAQCTKPNPAVRTRTLVYRIPELYRYRNSFFSENIGGGGGDGQDKENTAI
jgi:hypothetical protein